MRSIARTSTRFLFSLKTKIFQLCALCFSFDLHEERNGEFSSISNDRWKQPAAISYSLEVVCGTFVEFAVCRCSFLSGRYITRARHPLGRFFSSVRRTRTEIGVCPAKRMRNTAENSPVLFTGAEGKMPRINRGRQEEPDHLLGMAGTRYISIYARSGPDAAAAICFLGWDQPLAAATSSHSFFPKNRQVFDPSFWLKVRSISDRVFLDRTIRFSRRFSSIVAG